jgi:hypothetical protein
MAALAWRVAGKDRHRLLQGREIDAAAAWLDRAKTIPEPAVNDLQREFIESSRRSGRFRRLARIAAMVTALASMATAAGLAWWVRTDFYQIKTITADAPGRFPQAGDRAVGDWMAALARAERIDDLVDAARQLSDLPLRSYAFCPRRRRVVRST